MNIYQFSFLFFCIPFCFHLIHLHYMDMITNFERASRKKEISIKIQSRGKKRKKICIKLGGLPSSEQPSTMDPWVWYFFFLAAIDFMLVYEMKRNAEKRTPEFSIDAEKYSNHFRVWKWERLCLNITDCVRQILNDEAKRKILSNKYWKTMR